MVSADGDRSHAPSDGSSPAADPLVSASNQLPGRPQEPRGVTDPSPVASDARESGAPADPSDPNPWPTLAETRAALGQPEAEMAALERALAIDPRNFHALARIAALHEARGEPRAAAATWRMALQAVPRGLPSGAYDLLVHARAVVDANDRALEGFIEARLDAVRARHANAGQTRFDACLARLVGRRAPAGAPAMFRTRLGKPRAFRPQPTFLYMPDLPTFEFWDRGDFPWLDTIEAAADDMRAELIQVLAQGPTALEPYVAHTGTPGEQWRELNHSRRWGVFFLWKAGAPNPENMALCPRTMAALDAAWPRCDLPGAGPSAVFSILDAHTRIPAHVGVNNARLIVHLPLIVPPGCGSRVGSQTRHWTPGRAFVFDDTIEHEAWNDSDDPRAVLIFDIWNPFVTMAERDLLTALTTAVGDYYGTLPFYISGSSAA